MNNSKNVLRYIFGAGAFNNLPQLLKIRRLSAKQNNTGEFVIFLLDDFFKESNLLDEVMDKEIDSIYIVSTIEEPTTEYIDSLVTDIKQSKESLPCAVVGIGGGITLDVAKAIANLLTNPGKAEDYQGWDLVKHPATYKIGIPTLSGTGAEASRTCVMTNTKKKLKLGMNSEFTIYDQLILDPSLTKSVPRNQYFYSGMDTYIHCIESLKGSFRHAIGDAFSREALQLCKEVFESGDMQSDENRAKLMTASYFGGAAIANSFVGVVHPFSAGLSVVLGLHHCLANCIVMNVMDEFYPEETSYFRRLVSLNNIEIPNNISKSLTDLELDALFEATIIHEKPLTNALGDFRKILTRDKVCEVFLKM